LQHQTSFILSESNRVEFHAITESAWAKLVEACEQPIEMKTKDIIILRLYFTMLDQLSLVVIKDDRLFL